MSRTDQIVIDDFSCPLPDHIHLRDPQQLILLLEMLRNAFQLGHTVRQALEHYFSLLVDVGKVIVESAGQQKFRVESRAMLFQVILPWHIAKQAWSRVALSACLGG